VAGSLTGWSRRKLFALPVPTANLTDFPVEVPIVADADIGAACLASGYDIRFTAADGSTLLPYERESFAVAGGEATGVFWVKSDVAMAGTYIWCYYGNPDAADGEDHEAVWDANHKLVAHMNDLTTSTIHDSTLNHNDGTKKGANEPIEAVGKIGKGQDFDGIDDHITVPDSTSLRSPTTTNRLTWGCWLKGLTAWSAEYELFVAKAGTAVYFAVLNSKLYVSLSIGGTQRMLNSNFVATIGTWHLVRATWDGEFIRIYVDGELKNTSVSYAGQALDFTTNGIIFGRWTTTDVVNRFEGLLDEASISAVDRTAAWIAFEYANMNPADGGLTWGAEESLFMEILMNANELIVIRAKAVTFRANGAATASGNSKLTPVKVTQFKEAEFFLDVTAASGTTPTLNVAIVTKDPISGKWFTLVSFTQATGVTTERKVVTGNLGAFLAATWAIGGTGSPTFAFSIGAVLKAE